MLTALVLLALSHVARRWTGADYTAKDFRTWSGTVLAALALDAFEPVDSEAQAKKNIVQAIETVA